MTDHQRELDHLLAATPGVWGVALLDEAGALRYGWGERHVLPSASVIKVPLAWQCLELAADGVLDLDLAYPVQAADICDEEGSLAALAPGTPVAWRELLRVMVSESENNATNILLNLVGMQAANDWLGARGWAATRWRRKMMDFAARQRGIDNTTCAFEMASIMHGFARALPDPALEPLRQWLLDAVGDQKLEAGLPAGTPLAHKVGDLPGGVEHDAGIVTLPDGRWYAIAVLATQAPLVMQARRVAAEVSRRCWRWMGG